MKNQKTNNLLNPRNLYLLATIIAGFILALPGLNFIDLLSTGDHGRDLYASVAVTQGQLPYKDFWWVYGPIMPYYYGLFNILFGVHITSIFLGKLVIELALGSFFFLAAARFMPLMIAFIGAVWFMQMRPEFFFTFNHIGGLAAGMVVNYALFSYMQKRDTRYLWLGLIATFVFMLIKINFGLASLLGLSFCVFVTDKTYGIAFDEQKKKFYIMALAAIPALVILIYWLFLKDLPIYTIRQCFPYLGDDQPHHVSPLQAVPYYLQQHWITWTHQFNGALNSLQHLGSPMGLLMVFISWLYLLNSVLLHACTLTTIFILSFGLLNKEDRRHLLLGFFAVGVLFILYFQEFLVSGVWYRSYWSLPYLELFHFLTIATALKFAPKLLRGIVLGFLCVLIIFGSFVNYQTLNARKSPDHFLGMEKGRVYVGNEPQWVDTVNGITNFLNTQIPKDELFFALPYDCLYYYLSGKISPTRQLIFFQHIKIPPEQEISIIQELEQHHVNYILMSNRIASSEIGMGIFGKTYCPLIAQYIQDKFASFTSQGGNWKEEPGWGNNHGVIIFKRK